MQQEISSELAERFAQKIAKYTEYNVNIINAKGVIIAASRDIERIGTFHEAAYHMLQNNIDSLFIRNDKDFAGTRMGVNLLVKSGGIVYGVIGLSGDPDKIHDIAIIIKMSFETVIGYERQQVEALSRKSAQEQLFNALFLEVPPVPARLQMLAKQLNIETDCIRVAVLFQTEPSQNESGKTLFPGHWMPYLKEQDLCCRVDQDHLLVFFSIANIADGALREELQQRIGTVIEAVPSKKVYVGTCQNQLSCYEKAYAHCCWIEEHCTDSTDPVIFFYDHLEAYFSAFVPDSELYSVFHVYTKQYEDFFTDSFKKTVSVLDEVNYSITESSRKMFLHKNTMAFRIDKIKERMGIDPAHSKPDRVFLNWFSYYLDTLQ